jgi:hypothetical protein
MPLPKRQEIQALLHEEAMIVLAQVKEFGLDF